MTDVASRELRNDTAALLRRAAGEDITITVRGRPVAVPAWIAATAMAARVPLLTQDDDLDAVAGLADLEVIKV